MWCVVPSNLGATDTDMPIARAYRSSSLPVALEAIDHRNQDLVRSCVASRTSTIRSEWVRGRC